MNPVTLSECVNLRAVKYLNSRGKEWWKKTLKTDKDRKFEVEYTKVKSFLAGQLDGTGKLRVYSFADGKSFGRLFDSSGLQGMQKDIRGAVCDGVVSDLDMVNCHPMILSWICYNHDISCPNLEYYIQNREKIITDITLFNFDREDAKKLFLKSTNSQWRTKDIGYEFHKEYDAEMKRLQKKLHTLTEYNFIKPKVKKGDNELGSFINLCLCYHENEILIKAKEFLESKDIEVCTLAFDGLMHYGPELNELICELNEFINKEFDYPFKFVYKPHSKKIKVPADFDEESVTCLSYKCMCEQFNTSQAKVGNVYICEDIKGDKLIQTEIQLKHRYNHIRVHDKENQFIDNWLKNIQDTNMRVYVKFDICPLESKCPADVYNLWEPFTYSKMTGDYKFNEEGLNKILHLIKVLANHEEKSEKFLLDWMAQIIQYPHIKSVVPVIQSDEGAGKNTLMDILKELLGKSKVWDCTSPEEHIFGKFNDKMQDAFLINLNEANSSNFKGIMGKVKGMITEDTYDLQCKNQGTITLPSFHRFILMTNADYPINTHDKDRRFGIIQASNELIGNDDFFADLRANVLNNVTALRTFWDFLMSRKVSAKMTKDDLPNTEYHRELKKANSHPIIQWVENITLESKECVMEMNSHQAWDSYRCFCTDNNIPLNKTTKRGFEVSLSIKNIPGVSKKQGTNGRIRLFDLNLLREHFKIEPEVKKNDVEIDDPE